VAVHADVCLNALRIFRLAIRSLNTPNDTTRTRAASRKSAATRRIAFALALLFWATASPAQGLPAPFEAIYEGSKFPLSAKVTIALARMGDYYRFSLRGSVYATFFKWTDVYDCSVLHLKGDGFYPVEYVHRDTRARRHNVRTRFDWPQRTAQVTRGDGTRREIHDLPEIAWDPMSVQVRLRADVAAARRGAELGYDIVGKDKIKHRRVRVSGVDQVPFDGNALQVVKAESISDDHDDAFWFARDYAWLPVRVTMGGVTLDLVSPPGDAARTAAPSADGVPEC
jgi:hypothetical protein